MEIIDITFPISSRMPKWPGSVGFSFNWHMTMPKDSNNLSSIQMDSHFGTHIDAPLHFLKNGKSVEKIDLNKCIGDVFVSEIRNKSSITSSDLENADIPLTCKRLILKTDNQNFWEQDLTEFKEDFSSIDASGAKWIVDRGIMLVGIDYLSIQRFHDSADTHRILLEAEVVIIESLKLNMVQSGWYELVCMPINIEGLEGAPARVVLRNKFNL